MMGNTISFTNEKRYMIRSLKISFISIEAMVAPIRSIAIGVVMELSAPMVDVIGEGGIHLPHRSIWRAKSRSRRGNEILKA